MTYREFYKLVKNPLEKDDFIDKLVKAYVNSTDLYDGLAYFDAESKRIGEYFPKVRDILESETFIIWRDSLLKAAKNSTDNEFRNFALYVNEFDPKTEEEVLLARSSIKNKYKYFMVNYDYKRYDYDSLWTYKYSNVMQLDDSFDQKVEHRLYINSDTGLTEIIALRFIRKCMDRNMGYEFKYDKFGDRAEALVIYCDTYHLPIYTNMLREIKEELIEEGYDDVDDYLYNPPLLTGSIDGWIGYGSEPSHDDNLGLYEKSFNDKRAKHLEKCLNDQLINWFIENKNRFILDNGNKITYKEYVAKKVAKLCKEKELERFQKLSPIMKKRQGYSEEDVRSSKFEQDIAKDFLQSYDSIIKWLDFRADNSQIDFLYDRIAVYLNEKDLVKLFKTLFQEAVRSVPELRDDILNKICATSTDLNISVNYAFDLYALKLLINADKNSEDTIRVVKKI